jgi:putative endonuclease
MYLRALCAQKHLANVFRHIRQLAEDRCIIANMFHVYALYNNGADKIYIGQTDDLARRVEEHNRKLGNHDTARFDGEWVVIFAEAVDSRVDALRREKQLKTARGRKFVRSCIPA